MLQGFWRTLPKPFFVLAPLAGVTDAAFRRLIATHGKPHVLWTEFTSADGLCSPGRQHLLPNLLYTAAERPIVAQLYGANPAAMEQAAALVAALGFDGVDINMGCPDRSVEKRGAGAAMCKHPALAQAVIGAARRGAGTLPVSVKIRLGYHCNEIDTWLPALLEAEPAVVTIHARTRQEMSKVPARWDAIAQAVALRDAYGSEAYIVGNGDVKDIAEAQHKVNVTGVDGVMLGRAIFGNPWLFNAPVTAVPAAEKLRVLLEHTHLFMTLFSASKHFDVMKKHYKAYVSGLAGAKELGMRLMETRCVAEVEAAVQQYLEMLDTPTAEMSIPRPVSVYPAA
jgi:nifR3 family TIM-barrel protein